MLKALTLAALVAVATTPALAQTSAANSMGASTPPAAATTTTTAGSASTSTAGSAAASPAMIKVMQTCKADFAKACPNIAPSSPDMRTCVTANFSSLGQPCQGAIMEMMNAGGG